MLKRSPSNVNVKATKKHIQGYFHFTSMVKMKILDVGEKNIQHALENKVLHPMTNVEGIFLKMKLQKMSRIVINHINSVPVLAPHFTRKDT